MRSSNQAARLIVVDSNEVIANRDGSQRTGKSVRKMSESFNRRPIGKADSRYWAQPGKLLADSRSRFLSCKIQVAGRRESFPLRTPNKAAAAAKAAQIFGDVVALGWDAALKKHKPTTNKLRSGSVGELLTEVGATAGFRVTTFTTYSQCLRQVVAGIAGIEDQPATGENGEPQKDRKGRIRYCSRFDYRSGGRNLWTSKVDEQPLSLLSAEAVQRWRLAYVARAGSGPDATRRAKNSAAAIIRNARALFSPKALRFAAARLSLPEPLPFAGVKLEKGGSTRYLSKIDASELIAQARKELTGEPFQIFCLGLLCGLRKREIDTLLWRQVDFSAGQIRIEATEFFHPKSEDSIGAVDLEPELLTLMKEWKEDSNTGFVISSTRSPRHERSRTNYRCEAHFEKLYAWLRMQGVTARKPLHELRKELGAILASELGIFAAQRALRHAQISTTAAYYADKKQRISAGLGAHLL